MSQIFSFYREIDGKTAIRPSLFSKDACLEAREIYQSKFSSSQFRNYFQELRGLETRFMQREREAKDEAWLELQPHLHMLKAKLPRLLGGSRLGAKK